MALVAVAAVTWPLYRSEQKLSARSAGVGVLVVGLSALVYYQIGEPSARNLPDGPAAPSVAGQPPASVNEMVESLAARLDENPDDVEGWKMLGRSYLVMGNFEDAVAALERAVELEDSTDGQTLAALGEALFLQDNSSISGRAGELFETSLVLVPNNPKGLFYSGLRASNAGDNELAAERWEALLATSPPPEVANVLRTRIAEWRGTPVAEATPPPAANGSVTLQVDIGFGASVSALDPKTTVFVIARDPAQPAPPIAVDRRLAEELPTTVTLDSRNEMLPGRSLAGFEKLEVVVRASASGQPQAASGDWFGTANVDVTDSMAVTVEINQQVP